MEINEKKVAIITIYDPNPNYGNRIQNYATQTVLEKMGCNVSTISFERKLFTGKHRLKYYIHIVTGFRLAKSKLQWKTLRMRTKSFYKFNRRYIKSYHIKKLANIKPVDYYVIGSDQVWNPQWYDNCALKKDMFLLTFAPPEKKICFAPSFGVEKFPKEWEAWFQKNLKTFPRISVREEAGAKIVKELTGKKAEVLIDPTLMLNGKEWEKISQKPKAFKDNDYILTYFLGKRTKKVETDLKRISEEYHCQVHHILDEQDELLCAADPSEFLWLIENAKVILTDSFHACVFSFIFNRPFLVYERAGADCNMMSRIYTLLTKFDLERKYVDSGLENDIMECNYQEGKKILVSEQKKVYEFLKQSMDI